jgi:hypothetical protein
LHVLEKASATADACLKKASAVADCHLGLCCLFLDKPVAVWSGLPQLLKGLSQQLCMVNLVKGLVVFRKDQPVCVMCSAKGTQHEERVMLQL